MTDSRLSRQHTELLVLATPEIRVSQVNTEALASTIPDIRVSRVHIEVLWDSTLRFIGWGVPVR